MSQSRMWAEDPVSSASSVVDLPEILEMEARSALSAKLAPPPLPPVDVPIAILGVPFTSITFEQTVTRVEAMIASRRPHYIVTANVDFLVQARSDVELHRILADADLVLCDGQPLVWASRWLGRPLPERVAGSDLVPELIRLSAQKGYRIFFLGGSPKVAEQAVSNMESRYPNVKICGYYSPPFNPLLEMDHDVIAEKIAAAKPDLLFVSFGCPKAEKWMFMHYRSLGVPVVIGVGGTIDFLAQRLKRAPRWMQQTGTEWLFRMAQEPGRLVSRYSRDAREFGMAIVEQLWHLQWRRPRRVLCAPAAVDLTEPTWQRIHPPELLGQPFIESNANVWARALTHHCLFEMSHVRFIDSTGLGLLMQLQRQLIARNRFLVLLDPPPRVRQALKVMRVEHLFLIAGDTMEARDLISERLNQHRLISALSSHSTLPLVWKGEITAGNTDQVWAMAQTQIESFAEYTEPITIDLSGVSFIDSTGIGLLLRAQKFASVKGAALRFLNPTPAVRNVLRVARLEALLLGETAKSPPQPPSFGFVDRVRAQWSPLERKVAPQQTAPTPRRFP